MSVLLPPTPRLHAWCLQDCTEVQYVEALIKLQTSKALRQQKAGLSLALPGPVGVQVHAKASDAAAERRQQDVVARCEQKLGILPGARRAACGFPACGWCRHVRWFAVVWPLQCALDVFN